MVVGIVRVGLNPTLTIPTTIKKPVKGDFSRVKKVRDDSYERGFFSCEKNPGWLMSTRNEAGVFYATDTSIPLSVWVVKNWMTCCKLSVC